MTATRIFYDNKKMYNRLFWIDWISRLWGVGGAIWTVWLIVRTILNLKPGAHVQLTLPVDQVFQQFPGKSTYTGSPYVVQGTEVHFTQATMTVTHLDPGTVILLGLGDVFAAATSAALAFCIFWLVWHLRTRQPFAATLSRTLVAAGLILGIGSTLSTVAKTLGEATASDIADVGKYQQLHVTGGGDLIDFVPLFFAGLLFALAGVFRYGAALQKDTEGLV